MCVCVCVCVCVCACVADNVILDLSVFACEGCAAIHRQFGHKAKNVSMTSFSDKEVETLKAGGHKVSFVTSVSLSMDIVPRGMHQMLCLSFLSDLFFQKAAKKWLAKLGKEGYGKDLSDPVNLKEYMTAVYLEKKFYSEEPLPMVCVCVCISQRDFGYCRHMLLHPITVAAGLCDMSFWFIFVVWLFWDWHCFCGWSQAKEDKKEEKKEKKKVTLEKPASASAAPVESADVRKTHHSVKSACPVAIINLVSFIACCVELPSFSSAGLA